jgi:hypothetical protein
MLRQLVCWKIKTKALPVVENQNIHELYWYAILSKATGLDKYRIQSLVKIIDSDLLTPRQYQAAVMTLKEKCEVYAGGCRKRGREEEANYVYQLAEKYG